MTGECQIGSVGVGRGTPSAEPVGTHGTECRFGAEREFEMTTSARRPVWDPFSALVRGVDRDIDRRFDAMVDRAFGARRAAGFVPAADVVRSGEDVLITLELPGVDITNDVAVEVSQGRLVISGQRREEERADSDAVLAREIRGGGFRREFALPRHVTAEQVSADYDQGLLRVLVRQVTPREAVATRVPVRQAAVGTTVEPAEPEGERPTSE